MYIIHVQVTNQVTICNPTVPQQHEGHQTQILENVRVHTTLNVYHSYFRLVHEKIKYINVDGFVHWHEWEIIFPLL